MSKEIVILGAGYAGVLTALTARSIYQLMKLKLL